MTKEEQQKLIEDYSKSAGKKQKLWQMDKAIADAMGKEFNTKAPRNPKGVEFVLKKFFDYLNGEFPDEDDAYTDKYPEMDTIEDIDEDAAWWKPMDTYNFEPTDEPRVTEDLMEYLYGDDYPEEEYEKFYKMFDEKGLPLPDFDADPGTFYYSKGPTVLPPKYTYYSIHNYPSIQAKTDQASPGKEGLSHKLESFIQQQLKNDRSSDESALSKFVTDYGIPEDAEDRKHILRALKHDMSQRRKVQDYEKSGHYQNDDTGVWQSEDEDTRNAIINGLVDELNQ